MVSKVRFGISDKFPYSHCRACDIRMLWFSIWMVKEEWEDEGQEKPSVQFNQVGHKERPCYCPYCGKKELYLAEDEREDE